MSWQEFCTLLSGILPETPLGKIVAIRAEKDPKVLQKFTPEQKRVRNEWIKRRIQKIREDPQAYKAYMEEFQAFCRTSFSN